MLAQRANIVCRKFFAFVHKSANFADIPFFLRFGLGFYIALIIRIGHRRLIIQADTLCDITNEHNMRQKINLIDYFAGNKAVCIFIQEQKTIGRALNMCKRSKFIHIPAGLETEVGEHLKRCTFMQGRNIQHTCLGNYITGMIALVNGNRNAVRVVGQLGNSINNQSVVTISVFAGNNVQTIPNMEQSFGILPTHLPVQ